MMNWRVYPRNWNDLARACKERAGWKCEQCQVKQYTVIVPSLDALIVIVDPGVDHPKMIHLQAAHVNNRDRKNPKPTLKCWCPSCHAVNDAAYKQREARVALERLRHRQMMMLRTGWVRYGAMWRVVS